MAKKRKPPRKRANTRRDVEQQLARHTKNLDNWIGKSITAANKIAAYRKKVAHYQKRLDDMEAARIAELEEANRATQRELRSIQLGDD